MSQSRQLAAIMFTDIVGYTALMSEDEQKAFELLKKNRSVQRPLIEKFNGRWLKEIGDGVLASFPTVTDAVYCAKEIQESCHLESDLNLRIGIHLGEVVFEGDDVFGDGVNIASRLEPLAPVGGILVSESVHRNLGNKKNIVSTFIREEQLKNVKEPIKIYSVQVEGADPAVVPELSDAPKQVSPKVSSPRKMAFTVAGVLIVLLLSYFLYSTFNTQQVLIDAPLEITDKSIAVLPFKNDSLSLLPRKAYMAAK
jgi:class 3 adenylate cyclase